MEAFSRAYVDDEQLGARVAKIESKTIADLDIRKTLRASFGMELPIPDKFKYINLKNHVR